MTRRMQSGRSVSEILLLWEQATDSDSLQKSALQTGVYLSHVHDVPDDVLEALDGLMGMFGPSMASLHRVLRYLRELEEIERVTGN
ncbi:MAG: hypothetical protein M9921_09580 [Fimbriimonadaceae bacterium]|nr:hypothetical protein [Fimbriimonadaceae bacterium]